MSPLGGVRFPLWPLGGALTVIVAIMETVIPTVATGGRCDSLFPLGGGGAIPIVATGGRCDHHCFQRGSMQFSLWPLGGAVINCHRLGGLRFSLWPLGGALTVIISIMGCVIPIMATGGRCDHHCFQRGSMQFSLWPLGTL